MFQSRKMTKYRHILNLQSLQSLSTSAWLGFTQSILQILSIIGINPYVIHMLAHCSFSMNPTTNPIITTSGNIRQQYQAVSVGCVLTQSLFIDIILQTQDDYHILNVCLSIQIDQKARTKFEAVELCGTNIMIRQQTSQLYEQQVEAKLIKDVALIGCVFVIICSLIMVSGSIQLSNQQFKIWETQSEEFVVQKTDAVNSVISNFILFLNRTNLMFKNPMKNDTGSLCLKYANCQLGESSFTQNISRVYKPQAIQYRSISYTGQNPLVFYYDSQTQRTIGLHFNDSSINSSINSLMQPIESFKSLLKTNILSTQTSSYNYFLHAQYFVMCIRLQNLNKSKHCCVAFNTSLLISDQQSFKFIISFNNVSINNRFTLEQIIKSTKDQLHKKKLLKCEGFEFTDYFNGCLTKYLEQPIGKMKCFLTQVAFRALPVLVIRHAISLPAFSQTQFEKCLYDYNFDKIYITALPREDIYQRINEATLKQDRQVFAICELTLYALMLYTFFIILNRFYVQKGLIQKVEYLSSKNIDEIDTSDCFQEWKPLVEMSVKYEWMKKLTTQQQDKFELLLDGIQLFKQTTSDYHKVLEFIYFELVQLCQHRGQYAKQLQYYEELIKLKLKRFNKCKQIRIDMTAINQTYRLQISKANAYCHYLKQGKNTSSNVVFSDRLDQFEESFDIDQDLFDLSTLVKCKIRSIQGKPVSYRRLLQLQKSDNEDTRSEAYFITALELSKKSPQFDIDLVAKLCKALFECDTSSHFKRQCLIIFAQVLKRNGLSQNYIGEVKNMASYYSSGRKHFYVLIESFDGLDERLTKKILLRMISYLKQNDKIEFMSLSSDLRNNVVIEVSNPRAEDEFNEHLKRIAEQYEGSRRSKSSLVERLITSFRKIMDVPTSQSSKYIVIILSDNSYSDIRSEKDSIKKCQYQKLEIVNSYIHLVLIGNNIKCESFQKSKLLKSLKLVESFLQIDLKDCDPKSNKEQIDIFFKSHSTHTLQSQTLIG